VKRIFRPTSTGAARAARPFVFGAALAAFGCGQGSTEGNGHIASDLYLNGNPWPDGVVNVCFSGADGNNPTLLAEAQRVLADSWSKAASITFPGWQQCNLQPGPNGNFSTVQLHFCTATSNSQFCPIAFYDNKTQSAGGFRGLTFGGQGVVPFTFPNPNEEQPVVSLPFTPGVRDVSLVGDDGDKLLTRFRYEVIHEFGHALGFEHEQDRPDNLNPATGQPFCNNTIMPSGGTTETVFDYNSIMDYCARDPVTGGFPTHLSSLDIEGVRKVYGRASGSHGFMILSDTNGTLAVSAPGAKEQTVVQLSSGCTIGNPDCTWTYQRGMLISDTDPALAINAWGGAAEQTVLKVTAACTQTNPDCTWTYQGGQFLSDRDPSLAINAFGGAQLGTTLELTRTCSASNSDCTWTMPHVMLSSYTDQTLAFNAVGGAGNGTNLALNYACDPSNPDCTWTFSKGMMLSDRDPSLAINAFGGAQDGTGLRTVNDCAQSNPDCTWTWSQGQIISDNQANGTLPVVASGGAVQLANLALRTSILCTSNTDCIFSGLFSPNE
jgi:hypothetical protein